MVCTRARMVYGGTEPHLVRSIACCWGGGGWLGNWWADLLVWVCVAPVPSPTTAQSRPYRRQYCCTTSSTLLGNDKDCTWLQYRYLVLKSSALGQTMDRSLGSSTMEQFSGDGLACWRPSRSRRRTYAKRVVREVPAHTRLTVAPQCLPEREPPGVADSFDLRPGAASIDFDLI